MPFARVANIPAASLAGCGPSLGQQPPHADRSRTQGTALLAMLVGKAAANRSDLSSGMPSA